MFEFSTNQWAILGLVLVLGWLLGLMTLAGGRKWKRGYLAERDRRIALEREHATYEDRLAAHEAQSERLTLLEKERAAQDARIADFERRGVAPAVAPVTTATAGSVAMAASGQRDDLSLIFGVGRGGEQKLNDLGVHRYRDITTLSPIDEATLETRLGLESGEIAEERWREQADLLARGKFDEHARLFA
jgi:predicted flap endonuclease-1-like 5' DNA nuclease